MVFCHPDPKDRGSMNAPLMIAVTLRLVERGFSVLRFDFRGTGNSTGAHDLGDAEVSDVAAAIEVAGADAAGVRLAGWSFGAAVALSWLASQSEPIPYVGIAPPPQMLPAEVPPGPKRFILGTREQVIDSDALLGYAAAHSIDVVLTPGDHFFHGRGKKIGDLVAQGLE